MSIQAGCWNLNGEPVDPLMISRLSGLLADKGSDSESCYLDGPIALLYRAFHTTLESRVEKQPFRSRRGLILTWDGRLDNREELIQQLRDHLDADHTDVAIAAASFECWNTDCFRHLLGDWAVTIWEPFRQELLFACDYLSVRHIFYHHQAKSLRWATELAPLVQLSENKLHLDDEYIGGYLADNIPSHLTPYREMREVPAGHFVRLSKNRIVAERYWRFSPKSRIRYQTDREYEQHFRWAFYQSVGRRLRSDTPILAELSGGLDSSSIVCTADELLSKQANPPVLETISYIDLSEVSPDDWAYIQEVERRRHKTGIHIDASAFGRGDATRCPDFTALPGGTPWVEEIKAKRSSFVKAGGYRVILSGVGGDEFLGGVPNMASQLADQLIRLNIIGFGKQVMAWSVATRRPWLQLAWRALLALLPTSLVHRYLREGRIEHWIQRDFANRTRIASRQADSEDHFGLVLPTRRSCISAVLITANRLSKRISNAIPPAELRYPYLDRTLIEFILSIPAEQLQRVTERRSLMRRSLIGIVPNAILSRRTKQVGLRTPIRMLADHVEDLEFAFMSPLASRLGFVDRDSFTKAMHEAIRGKHVHIVRLMKIVSLELWLQDLVSRALVDIPKMSPQTVAAQPQAT
jgi:asparagine synthase (glutamine-hydrolysing)